MISKKQLSLITSLQHKKFRKEHGLFFAEGEKIVAELLHSDFVIRELYMTELYYENSFPQLNTTLSPVIITEKELKKISALTMPQQVLAVAEMPDYDFELSNLSNRLTLILDGIKDPGNLGTIIRIADWFGIVNIICSESSVDCFNPKVVQATMGSLFRIKISYCTLKNLFEENKRKESIPVYGTFLIGENIYKSALALSGFIVIGNESEGISEAVKKYITKPLMIPSFARTTSFSIDSLNAAMATAIVCSEFRRR
jgi:TrmH family RNA methyltransferase